MFTIQEQQLGLGIVITQMTRFDSQRMAAREKYYFNSIVDDYAKQYVEAGFEGYRSEFASGLSGLGFGFFGFGKKKKQEVPQIPYEEIFAIARPLARQYARQEEENRIVQEEQRIQQERQVETQKVRQRVVEFKLPEGVTSISRGALVISPVGQPVIRKK